MIRFVGSYTPERPIVISSGDHGDGTQRPIAHKRYTGSSSASDDIVRCQWRLNKVTLAAEGDVTMRFYAPAGSPDPPEDKTVHFSVSIEATASITGGDASVRLPSDIAPGDFASFSDSASNSYGVTTTWGPRSIDVGVIVNIGNSTGLNLGIDDTTFTNYYKGIVLGLSALAIAPGTTDSTLTVSTYNDGSYSALGTDCDPLLHSHAPLYSRADAGCSITISSFSLDRTDELSVP